jgi:hypothetical protein
MKAHYGAVETHSEPMEAHTRATEAHLRAKEAPTGDFATLTVAISLHLKPGRLTIKLWKLSESLGGPLVGPVALW